MEDDEYANNKNKGSASAYLSPTHYIGIGIAVFCAFVLPLWLSYTLHQETLQTRVTVDTALATAMKRQNDLVSEVNTLQTLLVTIATELAEIQSTQQTIDGSTKQFQLSWEALKNTVLNPKIEILRSTISKSQEELEKNYQSLKSTLQ
eukprot:PhF_6_TR4569/c0_g1_i1/m.6437